MSATKEFLYELQEFVWLIEFAPLTFEQRGKAITLYHEWVRERFEPARLVVDYYDTAYELTEENGGADWATGKQAERLLSLVA